MTKVEVKKSGHDSTVEDITIIDSRATSEWSISGVKAGGAIRIPPDEVDKHVPDVRRDKFAVTYCT